MIALACTVGAADGAYAFIWASGLRLLPSHPILQALSALLFSGIGLVLCVFIARRMRTLRGAFTAIVSLGLVGILLGLVDLHIIGT